MPELGIIFDMDGVLIDTVARNWQAYNEILADYGVHIANSRIYEFVGRPLQDQISSINGEFNVAIDAQEFEARAAVIEEKLFKELAPNPGVVTLLEALKSEGTKLAVGTSTPRDLAISRLRDADIYDYFDVVVAEDDVHAHKPNPEVFLVAAKHLGIRSSRCLVIEDAPAGVQAAKAGGFKCCGISNRFVPASALGSADLIVDSLENITPAQIQALIS